MYIASIQVSNYKSYRESSKLSLKTGINIITGQNNAGKTALVEAIGLTMGNIPHRSISTIPRVGMAPPTNSTIEALLILGQQELFDFVLTQQTNLFTICLPADGASLGVTNPFVFSHGASDSRTKLLNWTLDRDNFEITHSTFTNKPAISMPGSYETQKTRRSDYLC